MSEAISGIQQVGIGIPDVHDAWQWYRRNLDIDIPVFEEAAEANLMLPYTDGKPQQRHAILAISIQGGGGFEIWQYTNRTPKAPEFKIKLGDTGIYAPQIKCKDVEATYRKLADNGCEMSDGILTDPIGRKHFFFRDKFGNLFQVAKGRDWFKKTGALTGGVSGCILGVTDIERSLGLYRDILGYDHVVYDETGVFQDLAGLDGGNERYRRMVLTHKGDRTGPFSELFGSSEIELIQPLDREPNRIFKDRLWGDLGFIHLCFDVTDMGLLKEQLAAGNFHFTVDSSHSFDMGEAAGHFTYIEDPDGTLIEFVETHKVPILKKLGWYLNLKRRRSDKAVPRWMIKAMGLKRKKN